MAGIGYWAFKRGRGENSSPLLPAPCSLASSLVPNTHYLKDYFQSTGGIRSFALRL